MRVSLGLGWDLRFGQYFSFVSCIVLRDLSLNNITSIKSGDFAGLGKLTHLSVITTSLVIVLELISPVTHRDLSSNRISSIESGDFTGLGKLTYLSVTTWLVMVR